MKRNKIIILTCVHGRHETVKRCLNIHPEIERVIVYSNDSDGEFLKEQGQKNIFKFPNNPISEKWNYGISLLKDFDFDSVILMGSDDYFDKNFLDFIKEQSPNYEMIAFKDIFIEAYDGNIYHWGGYNNHRRGEPVGAGKTYSKGYLKRIKYNLFPAKSDKGLDGISWVVANFTNARMLITELKANKLLLVDIKDGQGMTPIESINGLKLYKLR